MAVCSIQSNLSEALCILRSAPEVDGSEADDVVPGREVVVPDDWCGGALLAVEHLDVAVSLAEVVAPKAFGSLYCHSHASNARLPRATVGVDHAVSLASASAVLVLLAHIALRLALQWFGTSADVVADGLTEGVLQDGVIPNLETDGKVKRGLGNSVVTVHKDYF